MCINKPSVVKFFLHNLCPDMHLPNNLSRINGTNTPRKSDNKDLAILYTVCTQCKRVLLPPRKNSAPTLRSSRDEDDQWVNFEDISNLHAESVANLSHGLCASCFQRINDSLPHSPQRQHQLQHIAQLRKSASPTKRPLQSNTNSSSRILVVDDNKLQRQIHKRMVEQAGFQCDVVSSGTQAIEMVQKHSYSLILMDLMMADTDGWTTSKTIRRVLLQTVGGRYAALPRIIAVTGMRVDSQLIRECAAAGMDDVVQKPVSPAALTRILAAHAGLALA